MPRAHTAAAEPHDYAHLIGAPDRLGYAKSAHARAAETVNALEARAAELTMRLREAAAEETAAQSAAEREQTSRREPAERGVTIKSFGGENPAGVGQQGGVVQGVDYDAAPAASPALARYARARAATEALRPLLASVAEERLPAARQALQAASDAHSRAQEDADALEVAKVAHALPALVEVDARFVAAADALEHARKVSEAARESLAQAFGYDARFAARHLVSGLPPALAQLAKDHAPAAPSRPSDLIDLHRRAFGQGE